MEGWDDDSGRFMSIGHEAELMDKYHLNIYIDAGRRENQKNEKHITIHGRRSQIGCIIR